MKILSKLVAFEWDKGNIDKNFKKHKVGDKEAEEIFRNEPKFIFGDDKHSDIEKRFMIWGRTNKKRTLAVFYTIRKNKIRIISARDMHKKERAIYYEKIKKNTKI